MGRVSKGFSLVNNGQYEPTQKYIKAFNHLIKANMQLSDLSRWIGVSKTNITQWGEGDRPGHKIEEWFDNHANYEELRIVIRAINKGMITLEEGITRLDNHFAFDEEEV